MASPAFGTASTATGAGPSSANYNVPVPSSVAADDVLLIVLFCDATTINPSGLPTGFAQKTNVTCSVASNAFTARLYWKRATAGDAGNYTFTGMGSYNWVEGLCLRVTGCVTSGDPFDITPSAASANATQTQSPDLGAQSTTVSDILLCHFCFNFAGKAVTPPSGYTERADTNDDVEASTLAQATAGSVGTPRASWTGNTATAAILAALKSPTSSAGGATFAPPPFLYSQAVRRAAYYRAEPRPDPARVDYRMTPGGLLAPNLNVQVAA
jgi:hypothetical protein